MSEKCENAVERNDERSPIPATPDTGELVEATGAELDQVEGGVRHGWFYVEGSFPTRSSGGGGHWVYR